MFTHSTTEMNIPTHLVQRLFYQSEVFNQMCMHSMSLGFGISNTLILTQTDCECTGTIAEKSSLT